MIFVVLVVGTNALQLLYGEMSLESYFTPSWLDFAVSNPELFALALVIGTLLIGTPFVKMVENI